MMESESSGEEEEQQQRSDVQPGTQSASEDEDDEEVAEPHSKIRRYSKDADAASDWRSRLDRMIQEKKDEKKAGQEARKAEQRKRKNAARNTLGDHGLKQTYGKGFDLLKKMGYQGGGIGKDGSGIANPLLVKVRERKKGLQDYGEALHQEEASQHPHGKLSSFGNSLSAIDILLGHTRRRKEDAEEQGTGQKAKGSGKWRKGTTSTPGGGSHGTANQVRVIYKTASEIAAESRLQHRSLTERLHAETVSVREEIEVLDGDDSDSGSEMEDWAGEYDEKQQSERPLGRKARLKREQARLRMSLYSTGEPSAPAPFRIVDMTGPSTRVINDVVELRMKLTEAAQKAERSIRFGVGFNSDASALPPPQEVDGLPTSPTGTTHSRTMYQFDSTGELLRAPRRQQGSDAPSLQMPDHADGDQEQQMEQRPLQELRHNLNVCIAHIESEIAQKARDKIYHEVKFQRALEKEAQCEIQVHELSEVSTSVEAILTAILEFRNSNEMKRVAHALCHRHRPSRKEDSARAPARSTVHSAIDDSYGQQQRREAVLKYSTPTAATPLPQTRTVVPPEQFHLQTSAASVYRAAPTPPTMMSEAQHEEEESRMLLSDDDEEVCTGDHIWRAGRSVNLEAKPAESQNPSSSAGAPSASLRDAADPVMSQDLSCFVSGSDLVLALSSLFKSLSTQYPQHYYRLQLPSLASQLATAIVLYVDTRQQQGDDSHQVVSSNTPPPRIHYRGTAASLARHPPPVEDESVLLVSLLYEFREHCLALPPTNACVGSSPPEFPSYPASPYSASSSSDAHEMLSAVVQSLRDLWQRRLDERILDSLRLTLRSLKIDPTAQDLGPLQSVLQWIGPISVDTIAQLLESELFPRWNQVLKLWLQSPTLDLEEIHLWYTGWKSFFPTPLCFHPIIEAQFMRGLQLISKHLERLATVAVDPRPCVSSVANTTGTVMAHAYDSYHPTIIRLTPGQRVTQPVSSSSSSPPSSPREAPPSSPPLPPSEDVTAGPPPGLDPVSSLLEQSSSSVSAATAESKLLSASRLVEVLEALAEEHNLVMLPKRGRMEQGKQVYGFGPVTLYVDSGVVHALRENVEGSKYWEIISLAALLKRVGAK